MSTNDRIHGAHRESERHNNGRKLAAALLALTLVALLGGLAWTLASSVRSSDQSAVEAPERVMSKPDALEAGLAAAAVHQRDGRFAEAAAIVARLAEQTPFDPRVRLAWAQALVGRGDHTGAYEQYQAAIAIEQDSSEALTNNPALAELHGEAGTCAMVAGLADRAVEHYTAAQTADTSNPRYPLYLAMAQIRSGNDAAAMVSLVRTTLLKPDLAEAWGTMAELELKQNHLGLAAQHLDKALALQPDSVKWRLVQGRLLNRKGEPEKALTVLSALPEQSRVAGPVLRLMGETYGLLNRPTDAAALYDNAARAAGSDAELWYQAALWHRRAGDEPRAAAAASNAALLGHEQARRFNEQNSTASGGEEAPG